MDPGKWQADQAVAAAHIRPFQGTAWRVHWREVAPTDWNLSLRTSGRYHRGLDLASPDEAFPALYTSLAPEIAIWEMVRRSAARNLCYLMNNVLTELDVDLVQLLDLSDPTTVGWSHAALTAADVWPCQELAAAAMTRGCDGLLVPSASLPGLNLVILPRNLPETPPIQIVRSTELPLETMARDREDDVGIEKT